MPEEVTTKPARTTPDGVALEGAWPHNRRLRAEALHAAGKGEDPDGIVTPDDIASAGERVAKVAKAEKEAEEAREKAAADEAAAAEKAAEAEAKRLERANAAEEKAAEKAAAKPALDGEQES